MIFLDIIVKVEIIAQIQHLRGCIRLSPLTIMQATRG